MIVRCGPGTGMAGPGATGVRGSIWSSVFMMGTAGPLAGGNVPWAGHGPGSKNKGRRSRIFTIEASQGRAGTAEARKKRAVMDGTVMLRVVVGPGSGVKRPNGESVQAPARVVPCSMRYKRFGTTVNVSVAEV